jgi:hypothetical protein
MRRRAEHAAEHRQLAEPTGQRTAARVIVDVQQEDVERRDDHREPEQARMGDVNRTEGHGSLRSRVWESKASSASSPAAISSITTNSCLLGTRSVRVRLTVSSLLRTVWKPRSNDS